jgi:hypothetical protein
LPGGAGPAAGIEAQSTGARAGPPEKADEGMGAAADWGFARHRP